MSEALDNAGAASQSSPNSSEVACQAAFHLASYADSLYRSVQDQISSPKWATAVAIIQDKKRQVSTRAVRLHTCAVPAARALHVAYQSGTDMAISVACAGQCTDCHSRPESLPLIGV